MSGPDSPGREWHRDDQVDEAEVARPQAWGTRFVRDFRRTMNAVSSVFDFATTPLPGCAPTRPSFETGCFIESKEEESS